MIAALAIFCLTSSLFILIPPTLGEYDQLMRPRVGWRSSPYGHQQDKSPNYWVSVAREMSAVIPNSTPSGIWILGEITGESCHLTFPSPGGSYANIHFSSTDKNEEYLDAFDASRMKIWLQVEPASANVETLIDLVLTRYKHHSCVVGFGIDVEWLEEAHYSHGRKVTNLEAERWLRRVKTHNSDYQLFLKHWLIDKMPTSYRHEDLVFVDNSQRFRDLDALMSEFKHWGSHFSSSKVGFQIGYMSDKSWWSRWTAPLSTIGNRLIEEIKNCKYIFWVDFTITDVYPLPGDLDKNGIVDMQDIALVAQAYSSFPKHPKWNPIADVNQDSTVNFRDIALVAKNLL